MLLYLHRPLRQILLHLMMLCLMIASYSFSSLDHLLENVPREGALNAKCSDGGTALH